MDIIYITLAFAKYNDRRCSLLQTFQQIYNLSFLLDILHLLDDIKVGTGSTRSTYIHNNGLNQSKSVSQNLEPSWETSQKTKAFDADAGSDS